MIPLDQNKLINFKSGLYVVSTPIGNLMDITLNALRILKISDLILCEDTRVSKKVLEKHHIRNKQLVSYHKFNEKKSLQKVVSLLEDKKIVSIISDAGTPCISDPGSILLNEITKKKINIFSIPGPSSVISAVSISGFSDKFIFYGFFPEKLKDIKKDLEILSKLNLTIVFFISAKKFNKNTIYLEKYFSDRRLLICKELTKMYEEHFRLEVSDIKDLKVNLRGEITLVLSEKLKDESEAHLEEKDKLKIRKMMKKFSIKDIVTEIKKNKDMPKKEIYKYCLKIKNEK